MELLPYIGLILIIAAVAYVRAWGFAHRVAPRGRR